MHRDYERFLASNKNAWSETTHKNYFYFLSRLPDPEDLNPSWIAEMLENYADTTKSTWMSYLTKLGEFLIDVSIEKALDLISFIVVTKPVYELAVYRSIWVDAPQQSVYERRDGYMLVAIASPSDPFGFSLHPIGEGNKRILDLLLGLPHCRGISDELPEEAA